VEEQRFKASLKLQSVGDGHVPKWSACLVTFISLIVKIGVNKIMKIMKIQLFVIEDLILIRLKYIQAIDHNVYYKKIINWFRILNIN